MRNADARRWLASVSTLARATLPARSLVACSSDGRELRGTARTRRPRSRRRREVLGPFDDLRPRTSASVASKITLLGYRAMGEFSVRARELTLAGEEAGEGTPVVLLHGLTATRRYVVMGSRALERGGHRVVAYDARGHGALGTPAPDDYGYEGLPTTCSPCSTTAASSAPSSPGRRWARTRSSASRSTSGTGPRRSSIVTPAYTPEGHAERWSAGTRSRRACARAASRASSRPTASRRCPRRGARR